MNNCCVKIPHKAVTRDENPWEDFGLPMFLLFGVFTALKNWVHSFLYESELQANIIPTDYPKPKPFLISLCGSNIPRALGQGLVGVWRLCHFPVVPTQGAIPEKGEI